MPKETRSKGSENLPQGFVGLTLIFKDFQGFSWIFMDFQGFSWIFMDFQGMKEISLHDLPKKIFAKNIRKKISLHDLPKI